MTTIRYYEPQEHTYYEVSVYNVEANTMIHQLRASGLDIVEVTQ